MSTYPGTFALSEPVGDTKIPDATISYVTARNRRFLFNFMQEEFEKSGLAQADLGARTGRGSDRISRILGQPANLTADTVAEILFAMTGAMIKYEAVYPLRPTARNDRNVPTSPSIISLDESRPKASEAPVIRVAPIGMPAGTIVPDPNPQIYLPTAA